MHTRCRPDAGCSTRCWLPGAGQGTERHGGVAAAAVLHASAQAAMQVGRRAAGVAAQARGAAHEWCFICCSCMLAVFAYPVQFSRTVLGGAASAQFAAQESCSRLVCLQPCCCWRASLLTASSSRRVGRLFPTRIQPGTHPTCHAHVSPPTPSMLPRAGTACPIWSWR